MQCISQMLGSAAFLQRWLAAALPVLKLLLSVNSFGSKCLAERLLPLFASAGQDASAS